jgi:MFS transporter, DHA1 family, tetracycline resistance protein
MKKNTPLILIFLTVFIDLLGFGILIPILPTFAIKELSVSEFQIGIALAIYSLTQFLFNPVLGNLSDKVGRRPIIIFTLFLNAVGYVIFAFSHSYLLLIISRVVAGIGGSSIGVAQAYIADVTTKENRSKGMGLIGAAFGLGFVFGPLIGGILSKYGYAVTGLVSAGFSLTAFFTTIFALPESLKLENKANASARKKLFDFNEFKSLITHPNIGILLVLFFILTFSNATIYGTFALLGHKIYGFTDMQNGYIFGIVGIVTAIVQGGLLNIIHKYLSEKKTISIGAIFMMIGLGALPYGGNFLGISIVCIIMSIGTGMLQPTILSLISKVTPDKEQGSILGMNQSMSAFARILGPLWGGFAFQYLGYQFPFLTGAVFTLLIFLISVSYLSKNIVLT